MTYCLPHADKLVKKKQVHAGSIGVCTREY